MKKFILTLNLILIFSLISFGQRQKTDPQAEQQPSRERISKKDSQKQKNKLQQDEADNPLLETATNIQAQLEGTLDVKKSKPGDSVVLKTTKALKQNGEVIIPKGTRLIGRVTEVQQKTKNNATSKLGVVFDRLQGNNLDMPINATIVSITQAAANASLGDTLNTDITGSSSSSGTISRGGSGGGGLLGGGLVGGVTNTVGGALNTTTQAVGNVTNTAGQTVGGTTQMLGRTINGIQITQATSGAVSSATTLSAVNRDIKLEKGVLFNLSLSSSDQQ